MDWSEHGSRPPSPGGGRRASGRSLKRKKFDDELVESSLPLSKRRHGEDGDFVDGSLSPTPVPQIRRARVPSPTASAASFDAPAMMMMAGAGADPGATSTFPAIDDYRLIINMHQVADLAVIQQAVRFSRHYRLKELKERWFATLYHLPTSRLVAAAVASLDYEARFTAARHALFSPIEENLLRTVTAAIDGGPPELEIFQRLLSSEQSSFFWTRTASDLQRHWHRMQQFDLLRPDATCGRYAFALPLDPNPRLVRPALTASFTELTEAIVMRHLDQARIGTSATAAEPPGLAAELDVIDRKQKRKIQRLELQISSWQLPTDLGVEITGLAPQLDGETLAMLRGRVLLYRMQSRQIVIGRNTATNLVDVDLAVEGPATRISRVQCTIKLKHDGVFYIRNKGKRVIYVNGQPLKTGLQRQIFSSSVLDIADMPLLFVVNDALLHPIRKELLSSAQ